MRSRRLFCFVLVMFVVVAGMVGCGTSNQPRENAGEPLADSGGESALVERYQKTVSEVDAQIQHERIYEEMGLRIGATLSEPKQFYRDGEPALEEIEDGRLLRVWVREARTKRYIPGGGVSATFLNDRGETLDTVRLQAVWDGFYGYAQNVSLPNGTDSIQFGIGPANVGRHAEMRNRYTSGVGAEFPSLQSREGSVQFPEKKPSLVEDYAIGTDVKKALEEALEVKRVGPYRIGFIAEGSEPYWVPDQMNGELTLRPAEFAEDANRHVEALVIDAKSGQLVPMADVGMKFKAERDSVKSVGVPFLLAEFYHYGHSISLKPRDYTVEVTVAPPPLAIPDSRDFTTKTVEFDWDSSAGGHHEENYESDEHNGGY